MFNPIAARAVHRAAGRCTDHGLAIDFGNQRFDAHGVIGAGDGGLAYREVKTTKEFFLALGLAQYRALDINTDRDAIVVDLNEPVNLPFGHASIIVNNGTGEHIFDQASVFRNMHNLSRPDGGVMLNVLPLLPWVNHGFYNYTPILFRDIAAANGYRWNFLWLSTRSGQPVNIITTPDSPAFVEKRPREFREIIRKLGRNELYLVTCYSRQDDRPFVVPMQGKYVADIADPGLAARYGAGA